MWVDSADEQITEFCTAVCDMTILNGKYVYPKKYLFVSRVVS